MAFSFKSKNNGPLHNLSEEDIRSKLYGSAVAAVPDIHDKPQPKKKQEPQAPSDDNLKEGLEAARIRHDLESLRQELEQTKRKLKRMQGVKAKKIRLIFTASIVGIVVVVFTVLTMRFIFRPREASQSVSTAPIAKSAGYTIQVAVSADFEEAKKYIANLKSKGYKAFMHKSKYKSGKDKFIICVGGFKTAKSADGVLKSLKEKEGISDSFVISMPK